MTVIHSVNVSRPDAIVIVGTKRMSVEIPSDLSPFVDAVIRSGQYVSESEVVAKALRLLKRREALADDIRVGIEQLDRGESVNGEQVFAELRAKTAALKLDP